MNDIIEGFRTVAVASVADAVDKICGKRGYMDSCIVPRINDKRVVGPAATVLETATDEFLPPQHALDLIDEAPAGSVIVISICLLYTSPSPRDGLLSRMPSSA